jgi:hypothetical protein
MSKSGKSQWTVDTLKNHYDQKFIDNNAFIDRRFADADKALTAALNAAKEAVGKAETAATKRFESVNEFRAQLSDQVATFLPRTEADIRFTSLSDKIDTNTSSIDRTGGGSTASQRALSVGLSLAAMLVSIGAIIAIVLVAH